MQTVVTGKLIEEPSQVLQRRIKLLIVMYFINSIWIFYQYAGRHTSSVEWVHLAATTLLFVFLIPNFGLTASETPGSGRLACFTGIQGCLGCWNIGTLISLIAFVVTLSMICQTCEPEFRAGNETCFLDEHSSMTHRSLVIELKDCQAPNPSLTTIVNGALMLGMACASLLVAFSGRKTGKARTVHVVTLEPVSVEPVIDPPIRIVAPEDNVL